MRKQKTWFVGVGYIGVGLNSLINPTDTFFNLASKWMVVVVVVVVRNTLMKRRI